MLDEILVGAFVAAPLAGKEGLWGIAGLVVFRV